jgi:hypothetical protein
LHSGAVEDSVLLKYDKPLVPEAIAFEAETAIKKFKT